MNSSNQSIPFFTTIILLIECKSLLAFSLLFLLCRIKALVTAIIIKFIKHGDKSSNSNLNKDKTQFGSWELIIRSIIFQISENLVFIGGSIIPHPILNSFLKYSKCF